MDRLRISLTAGGNGAVAKRHVTDLRKAIRLDSQDPVKMKLLGDVLVKLGLNGTEAYRNALAIDPTWHEPLPALLAPLAQKGDWAAALALAESAAEHAPLVPEFWLMAADLAAKAGRGALAIAYAQRGLCLAPHHSDKNRRVAALYQALDLPGAGRSRLAIADRLQVRQGRPGSA